MVNLLTKAPILIKAFNILLSLLNLFVVVSFLKQYLPVLPYK
jgi:hypothetical protein